MNLMFHHFGLACRNISVERDVYLQLGYSVEGTEFVDENQGVRGQFLTGGGPRLELLEALPNSSVLESWLLGGSRIYHQAFESDDLERSIEQFFHRKAKMVVEPTPAVAFGGRHICFLVLRNLALIELIERKPASSTKQAISV